MKITHLKKGDVLVSYVNIGNMPPKRAKLFLDEVKAALREQFVNPVVLIATHNNTSSEIEIIRPDS